MPLCFVFKIFPAHTDILDRALHESEREVFPGSGEVRSVTLRRSGPGSIHIRPIRWGGENVSGQRVRTHGDSGVPPSLGHPVLVDARGSQRTHINQPPALPCQGASHPPRASHYMIRFVGTLSFIRTSQQQRAASAIRSSRSMLFVHLFCAKNNPLVFFNSSSKNKGGLWNDEWKYS